MQNKTVNLCDLQVLHLQDGLVGERKLLLELSEYSNPVSVHVVKND